MELQLCILRVIYKVCQNWFSEDEEWVVIDIIYNNINGFFNCYISKQIFNIKWSEYSFIWLLCKYDLNNFLVLILFYIYLPYGVIRWFIVFISS